VYKEYNSWYIYQGRKAKRQWCYLSKELLEKEEIKEALKETTQTTTQTTTNTTQMENKENSLNSSFIHSLSP
jgi:hypothetical protein